LEPFFNEAIEQVTDPETNVSIKERKYAKTMVDSNSAGRKKMMGNKYIKIGALGAGSDYTPFLQHLGIASLDISFGGQSNGDQYHSIYDTYDHFTRFIDPGFKYGVALSKVKGLLMMRLANADILPINFNSFYKTVNDYAMEVKTLLENSRKDVEIESKMIKEKLFNLAKDPEKVYGPPPAKEAVPFLNFSNLENELVQLKNASEEFQELYKKATQLPTDKQNELNTILYKVERSLMWEKGLPRRSWYKHQIYAPGYYTGYGVKTLPGIREGIEERRWNEAQEYIEIVAKTLKGYIKQVNAANALLK
jgi:N-acetylated-alpha-linked acidic dipeptidase